MPLHTVDKRISSRHNLKKNRFTNPLLYYKFTYEIVNLSINFRSLKVVHNSGVERFLS